MKKLYTAEELQAWRKEQALESVGFVPTLGGLHDGHMTLIERATQECSSVLVSVFLNPTQFNDPKDLQNYPADLDEDLRKLEHAGVKAVFLPNFNEMYPDNFRYEVSEKELSKILCGAHRPGHFTGMLTIVLKLLILAAPFKAYFGEKDLQQLKLVQGLVKAFFLSVEIVPCATVREPDGLAMSSRNRMLSPADRERASFLNRVIRESSTLQSAKSKLEMAGFSVDYIEEHWGRRLAAAKLGPVRLIDNVEI